MSAPISDVVSVVVTAASAASVQAPGFGKGLITAVHHHFVGRTKQYAAAAELVTDGFLTTDAAYLAVSAYFAQNPAPLKVKVGKRSADVVNIAITAVNDFTYVVTINGVAYSYLADGSATQAEIGGGLVTAIGVAVTGLTPTYSTGVLTLTGTTDLDFSVAVSANLTVSTLSATATLAHDLDAMLLYDSDFYGLVIASDRTSAAAQAAAAWAATNKKLLFTMSAEANVINVAVGSDTTTLPAILKASGYDALCLYHETAATNFIDAAAMGWVLARTPGSYTFALKSLIGIAVSSLTPAQRANALAKYAVTYEERGGLNQTSNGKASSGRNVDQITGRAWLANQVMINIFTLLSSLDKVEFTDDGITAVDQAVRQAGALGVNNKYLSVYTTTFPLAKNVSAGDKAARSLTGAKMVATESGAIESVQFNITVQV